MDPPPGLVTDSDSCYSNDSESDSSDTPWEDESSDEDWVSATPKKIKKTKKKTQSKTKSKSNVEVYEGVGTKASVRQESERKKEKYVKKKGGKKGRIMRATIHLQAKCGVSITASSRNSLRPLFVDARINS